MCENNRNINIRGESFWRLFLGIVLCVFFAAACGGGGGGDAGPSTPSFGSSTIDAPSYTAGTAIRPLTLPVATGGNRTLTYSIDLGSLEGLMFDPSTRQLSGTPSVRGVAVGRYSIPVTYTVTDADGETDTLSFRITVEVTDPMPTFGSEMIGDRTYIEGEIISTETLPEARGGDGTLTYSIDPVSPFGLTFDSSTRQLSGTPTVVGGPTRTVTYTATDADGDPISLTFRITVAADVRPSFGSEMIDDQNYIQTAITPLTLPLATGGNGALTYSINPVSPLGLTFDPSTRQLSGTPTSSGDSTTVTYTATDADGDPTMPPLMFTITVAADVRPSFGMDDDELDAQNYIQNLAITPLTLPLASGGNGELSYSIIPESPFGLTFDPVARTLSGIPSRVGSAIIVEYKVVDEDDNTDSRDEDLLWFEMSVAADTAPEFRPGDNIPAQNYIEGIEITPLTLPRVATSGNGGTAGLSYTIGPASPFGLMFDPVTQILSGTPSGTGTVSVIYTVADGDRNTQASDSGTLTFTINVAENPDPFFTEQIADRVYVQGRPGVSVILPEAMSGIGELTYSLAPLPNGMLFDPGTRELSGSPTLVGTTSVTYTARDVDGDTAELMFNVISTVSQIKNICGRTQQVRDAILERINEIFNAVTCDAVTEVHLESITGIRAPLDLRDKGITSLQADDFDGLSRLTDLYLSNNDLSSLPADLFDGLSRLNVLELESNDLSSLPAGLFDGLSNLSSLSLNENRLTTLHEDLFDGLSNLHVLRMNHNRLTTLHEELFDGLTNLEWLYLQYNPLTMGLPETVFAGLVNLEKLSLNNDNRISFGIANPPADLFDGLTNLQELHLGGNNIANPPADLFDGLTSLRELTMAYNMIDSLPAGLFDDLTSLTNLDLRGNSLTLPTPAICNRQGVTCQLGNP